MAMKTWHSAARKEKHMFGNQYFSRTNVVALPVKFLLNGLQGVILKSLQEVSNAFLYVSFDPPKLM